MRISDWSSDVCSSDLQGEQKRIAGDLAAARRVLSIVGEDGLNQLRKFLERNARHVFDGRLGLERVAQAKRGIESRPSARDRKPIDLAHILFEAACDVESAERFDQPDHVQYLWRVDFHASALADDRSEGREV